VSRTSIPDTLIRRGEEGGDELEFASLRETLSARVVSPKLAIVEDAKRQ